MENLKLKLGFAGIGLFALGAVVLSGAPANNLLANLTDSVDTVEEIDTNQETIEETVQEETVIEETAPEEVVETPQSVEDIPVEETPTVPTEQEEPIEEVTPTIPEPSEVSELREQIAELERKQEDERKERETALRTFEYESKYDAIVQKYEVKLEPVRKKIAFHENLLKQQGKFPVEPGNVLAYEYLTHQYRSRDSIEDERDDELRALKEEYSDLSKI